MFFIACATCGHASKPRCTGMLTIVHEDENSNEYRLDLKGHQFRYKNVKRRFPVLRKNSITHLNTQGNCCWKLYERSRFRGRTEVVVLGVEQFKPSFQLMSIMKAECHEYKLNEYILSR